MARQSMISDDGAMYRWGPTVIETARKAAGLSQYQLAQRARTKQSSVSEYEARKKSPTLDVAERLLDAAEAELVVRPLVDFDVVEDPEVGRFLVPDRLWSVPIPYCFSRVQMLRYIFETDTDQIWDLSDRTERIAFYELALCHGLSDILLNSVDGHLLVDVWPHLNLPAVIREAWQPVIDAWGQAPDGPPRDPGGLSARIAGEVGLAWPPPKRRRRRPPRPE
jgi:transcriptional regulator with XRE-family HTH domain